MEVLPASASRHERQTNCVRNGFAVCSANDRRRQLFQNLESRKQKLGIQLVQNAEMAKTKSGNGEFSALTILKTESRDMPNQLVGSEITKQGRLSVEFRNRTKRFASGAIRFFIKLPKGREEVRTLGKQLLRSGTSVAAQVREAARARSDAEFCSKLEGALQEADESQLWLELLQEDCGITDASLNLLHREAGELMAIFITMVNKTKNRDDKS